MDATACSNAATVAGTRDARLRISDPISAQTDASTDTREHHASVDARTTAKRVIETAIGTVPNVVTSITVMLARTPVKNHALTPIATKPETAFQIKRQFVG